MVFNDKVITILTTIKIKTGQRLVGVLIVSSYFILIRYYPAFETINGCWLIHFSFAVLEI